MITDVISDVLYSASRGINNYLSSPIHGRLYSGALRIEACVREMDALRAELDRDPGGA
jgi:hypothetical protein